MDELLAYWLVPATPHAERFSQQIAELAGELDAPVFAPHVTIYAGPGAGLNSPGAILTAAARELQPITLQPVRIGHSAKYTKTLFVEFTASEPLATLSSRIRDLSSGPSEYELHPHLSLAYQHLEEDRRVALAQRLPLPPGPVTFDEVQAVICRTPIQSAEDVRSWRVVHRQKLSAEEVRG